MHEPNAEHWGRIFLAFCALALVWVGVYWWWEPAEPAVTRPDDDPPAAAPTVVPPAFRPYTLGPGDTTFAAIAARELGDASLGDAIARANPFVSADRLRPGRVIQIPVDPSNIQGRVVPPPERSGTGSRTPPPQEPTPQPPTPPDQAVEYVVRPNDTLTAIAQRHYGSVRFVDLIVEANRDTIRDRNNLTIGMVLRLPPRPAGDP